MKTRLQLLEDAHDNVSAQVLQGEINIRKFRRKMLTIKGDEQIKLTKGIHELEDMNKELREVIDIIDDEIKKEKEKNG